MERILIVYLVNSLWQAPLLAAGAWLVLRAVKPGPRVQHGVWVTALVLIVAMPLLSLRGVGVEEVVVPVTAPTVAMPVVESVEVPDAVPVVAQVSAQQSVAVSSEEEPARWSRLREVRLSAGATHLAVELYLAVVLFATMRLLWSWVVARRMVAEALPVVLSEAELALFEACCERMEVRRPEVLVSERTSSPLVVGVLRPVLLLPERFAGPKESDGRELEAVWWHELAHVRRRDYLANLICRIWALPVAYHPATHAVERRVRQTREMVCDGMAAEAMQSPVRYARCLVGLAQKMQDRQAMAEQMGMFDGGVLEERVRELIGTKETVRMRAVRLAGGVAMLVAVMGVAAMFRVKPTMAEVAAGIDHALLSEGVASQVIVKPADVANHTVDVRNLALVPRVPDAGSPVPRPVVAATEVVCRPQVVGSEKVLENRVLAPLLIQMGDTASVRRGLISPTNAENFLEVRIASVDTANCMQVQGAVVLRAIISKTGEIRDYAVASGPKVLLSSAVGAAKHWTYEPYWLNGAPVEVATTITVNYFGDGVYIRQPPTAAPVILTSNLNRPTPPTPVLAASAPEPSADKPINFDIVSIRPHTSEACRETGTCSDKIYLPTDGDGFTFTGATMISVIRFAYGVGSRGQWRVLQAPDWVDSERYDIQAKVAESDVAAWQKMSINAHRLMVRSLLPGLLKLQAHDDTSQHPIYALVVAKQGLKLKEAKPGDTFKRPDGRVVEGSVLIWISPTDMVGQATTMATLVNSLSWRVGRVVVDETGLTAKYNFTLSLPYQQPSPGTFEPDSSLPSIFSQLRQLGLYLKSTKGPLNDLVIDHIERPSAN